MMQPTDQTTSTDKDTITEHFKKAEQQADKQWETEKDKISGVNKEIEKKQEDGTLKPEDTQNLGD